MHSIMKAHEIEHLASLARIQLSPEEITNLHSEIQDIVGYVSAVQSLTTEAVSTKTLGARYNVFRSDEVTNTPREYTDRLLAAAPETHDGYLVVKKIINQDES